MNDASRRVLGAAFTTYIVLLALRGLAEMAFDLVTYVRRRFLNRR